jgi:hypothetical protein
MCLKGDLYVLMTVAFGKRCCHLVGAAKRTFRPIASDRWRNFKKISSPFFHFKSNGYYLTIYVSELVSLDLKNAIDFNW